MGIFKIKAAEFEWIGGVADDPQDRCLHGHVTVQFGDTVLDDSSDYGNVKLVVNANRVEDGGFLKPGSVCYVKSVDFYVETAEGSNTYVKYKVTVNDYVEIK